MTCLSVIHRSMQIPERIAYIRPSPSMAIESDERFPLYKPRTHRSDLGSEEDIGPSVRREPFLRRDRVLGDAMNPDGTKQPNLKVNKKQKYTIFESYMFMANK